MISDEDRAIAEGVARFSGRLRDKAAEIDRTGAFAGCHVPALAKLGVMGLNLPAEWDGPGTSPVALFLAVEEMAAACASTASMVTAHYLATDAVLHGGDNALRQRYLPDAAAGKTLGAFALTEPAAGSNPADMTTKAVRCGDEYHLRGVKHFISNAGHADFIVVFALTDPDKGARGVSAFVVDRGTQGLEIGSPQPTMGLKGGHVYEVFIDVRIPASQRIGDEGTGFRTAMKTLDNGRVEVAAMCSGIARAALAAATEWAKTRKVGGAPIGDFQGLQWMLADMATQLEAARLLGLQAAMLRRDGARFTREASMAKLFGSEMVAKVTDLALQIHGGYGYASELPLERYVRDARILRIFEGSSEIQRNIIARAMLG